MTYYGRWTYKYEIASEKGAAACLTVHETGPAGYPYQVVTGSWGRENFDLFLPDGNSGRGDRRGLAALEKARQIFQAAGKDFDAPQGVGLTQGLQACPPGCEGGVLGQEQAPQGRLQERRRPPRRL